MDQRRNVGLSCLLCVVAVVAVFGLIFIIDKRAISVIEPADSCEQLEVSVEFPSGAQRIHAWKSPGGTIYFFLPAGAENYNTRFCNLGEESVLLLDSQQFTSENCDIVEIEYFRIYTAVLALTDGGRPLDSEQVIFLKSAGVPALFIDTASGNMEAVHADKEVKEPASMSLIEPDGSSGYFGELEYIKTRGNSTFHMEKKSYQIRFPKENVLLGMPGAEKWILLADMIDDSLIKNELIFQFAERYTEVPSIEGRFVDLYLNGEYAGSYYLCEKIEVGGNRLDITDLAEATNQVNYRKDYENAALYVSGDGKIKAVEGLKNPIDFTGGYLVEMVSQDTYESAENAFVTDGGRHFVIVSPDPATVEQAEYICNLFNEMETAVGQGDGIHPETGKHFSEYLDIDSWVSKYLIDEVFHNPDAAQFSVFFYKDSDSVDPLIYAGPVWDYDRALGSYGTKKYYLDSPEQVGEFGIYVQEMLQHQEVQEQVYDMFCKCFFPYVEYQASADIYRISEEVKESARMDQVRWPVSYGYYSDMEASRDYLIYFLKQKVEYLEEVWLEEEEFCTVTFLDYYGNTYTQYTVKKGEFIDSTPTISAFAAVFSGWYTVEDEIPFDSRLPILQDVTYEPHWIDVSILLTNGLAISEMDASQVDVESLQAIIDQVEARQNQAVDEAGDGDGEE